MYLMTDPICVSLSESLLVGLLRPSSKVDLTSFG